MSSEFHNMCQDFINHAGSMRTLAEALCTKCHSKVAYHLIWGRVCHCPSLTVQTGVYPAAQIMAGQVLRLVWRTQLTRLFHPGRPRAVQVGVVRVLHLCYSSLHMTIQACPLGLQRLQRIDRIAQEQSRSPNFSEGMAFQLLSNHRREAISLQPMDRQPNLRALVLSTERTDQHRRSMVMPLHHTLVVSCRRSI